MLTKNYKKHVKLHNCEICNTKNNCLIVNHIPVKQCIVCSKCIDKIFEKCPICQTLITSSNYGENILDDFEYISFEMKPVLSINHSSGPRNSFPFHLIREPLYDDPYFIVSNFCFEVYINNFRDFRELVKISNETFYEMLKNKDYNITADSAMSFLQKKYYKKKEHEIYKILINLIISLENSEGFSPFYKKEFYKENINYISKYSSLEKCNRKCANKNIISLLIFKQRGKIIIPTEIIYIIYKQLFNLKPCLCFFKLSDKNIF